MATTQECAHEACTCTVAPGMSYCSDACAQVVEGGQGHGPGGCPCGHSDCD